MTVVQGARLIDPLVAAAANGEPYGIARLVRRWAARPIVRGLLKATGGRNVNQLLSPGDGWLAGSPCDGAGSLSCGRAVSVKGYPNRNVFPSVQRAVRVAFRLRLGWSRRILICR